MTKDAGYRDVLKDDESLALFLRQMAKFDRCFCEAMNAGVDFTLKMELHGCRGKLIHCRVSSDDFERPNGPEADPRRNLRIARESSISV